MSTGRPARPESSWGVSLAVGWLLIVAAVSTLGHLPPGRRMVPYLALHLALSVLGLASWEALREAGSRQLRVVVMIGLAGHALLLSSPPFTSTDPSRYLWDGAVLLAGFDPYLHAPEDAALSGVAAVFPQPADHLDVPTCYPPPALALFAMASSLGAGASLSAWKFLISTAASVTVLSTWRHLQGSASERHVVLLALSPLVLLETGVGAHLETLVSLAITAGAISLTHGRWGRAGLLLGTAGALKLLPVLLALPLVVHAPRRVRFVGGLCVAGGLAVGLTAATGLLPIGSLPLFARTWSFGSPLFAALRSLTDDEDGIRFVLLAAAMLGLVLVGASRREPLLALRAGLTIVLVANPTLYPWYAVPAIPLLALTWEHAPAWHLLLPLAVLPLSYEVVDAYQASGRWDPAAWPVIALAMAVAVGALADGFVARGRARGHSAPTL